MFFYIVFAPILLHDAKENPSFLSFFPIKSKPHTQLVRHKGARKTVVISKDYENLNVVMKKGGSCFY